MNHALSLVAVVALLGCAADVDEEQRPTPATRFEACGADELAILDAGCRAVGVPSASCAEGFRAEHGGCAPILPAAPCGEGELAIPGETSCRPVAPCGDEAFGTEAIHVDAAATGSAPDGTTARPFKTVQAAIDALDATRTTIAIAPGTYVENLVVRRAARIVGRCPTLVEIRAASASEPAVTLTSSVTLERVSVTGGGIGVAVADAKGVLLDRVRVHDTAYIGIAALQRTRATEVVVRDSLIEQAHESGVASTGATLSLERSVVRDTTSARPEVPAGFGVSALFGATSKTAADVKLTRSVIERSVLVSISVVGSRVSLDGALVRETRGVALKATPGSGPNPEVRVTGSVLEGSRDVGVELLDCAATFERSVIRDVVAAGTGAGVGIRGGDLTMLDSLIEDVRGAGLVIAAPARVAGTIVRRVTPLAMSGTGELGVGIVIDAPTDASLTNVLVAETHTAGVLVFGANLTVTGSRIRDTAPTSNALFGDGLVLIARADAAGEVVPARAAVERTEILRSARAGIATFASSVSVFASRVACASFDLAVVPSFVDSEGRTLASDAKLSDLGDNGCGCEAPSACRASAASLQAIPPPAAR